MAQDGTPHIKLSLWDKLSIWKEKLLYGGASNEPEEFLDEYNKLLHLRNQLANVELGIKKWHKSSKMLADSAMFLARAVDTEKDLYMQLSSDLERQLKDKGTLQAIHRKIAMLNDLVKDRQALATLRHIKNRSKRKMKNAIEKGATEKVREKLHHKEQMDTERYETHKAQLLASIRYVNGEAQENGHCYLIKPELAAFKLSQFQFFLDCQKIIQGADREEAEDLTESWNKFTVELTDKREVAKKRISREFPQSMATSPPPTSSALATHHEEEKHYDDESDEEVEEEEEERKYTPAPQKKEEEEGQHFSDDEEEEEEEQHVEPEQQHFSDDEDFDDHHVQPEVLGSAADAHTKALEAALKRRTTQTF